MLIIQAAENEKKWLKLEQNDEYQNHCHEHTGFSNILNIWILIQVN